MAKKNWGVYKRIVGVGTERIADVVEADSDRTAISQTIGDHLISGAGAITYNGGVFRAYQGNSNGVYYFAAEVY